jgi:hypothetical protein
MSCVIYDQLNPAQYRRHLDTKARVHLAALEIKERGNTMRNDETNESNDNSPARDKGDDAYQEPTRDEERGEASEPDAPTSGEENDGMSTILNGGVGTGVQDDIDDE